MDDLSGPALYAWGCVGGAITAITLYVLPELIHASRTGTFTVSPSRLRIVSVVLLVLVISAIAGFAAFIPAHVTRPGIAILLGITAQATLKGLINGAQEAVRP